MPWVAIAAMVCAGEREIADILVLGQSDEPLTPCGACRQVINEFGPGALIISVCDGPGRIETSLAALLPDAFGPKNLR